MKFTMNAKQKILDFFTENHTGWYYAANVAEYTEVSQGRAYALIKELHKEGKLRVKAGKLSVTRQVMTLYQVKSPGPIGEIS